MKRITVVFGILGVLLVAGCAGGMGRPPRGSEESASDEQRAAITRVRAQVDGWIAWSSSRLGNHDIFVMKTDGSEVRRLTSGEHVDWYPRFDPAGGRLLFTRSKRGWVSEMDANRPEKWDLYTLPFPGGGVPTKVVDSCSWGVWIGPDRVMCARQTRVMARDLGSGAEEVLADSAQAPALGGADLQNPHLSADGKYLAVTLRGSRRETGIYSLERKTWVKTGEGCQVNWFPAGDRIYWVNPSGNGGSEVFSAPVRDGALARDLPYEQLRFIDIPGRRSHEYFPQLDRDGQWLVWAATRRGHDHDIADYEIYIWKVGAPAEHAARLTFHSGNDRWPDIFVRTK